MKKAISILSFCVVAALSMVGCSNLSVNGVNDQQIQTTGNSTVHFSIDLNNIDQSPQPTSLAKAAIGDGLTITERQAILAYRKSKVKSLTIVFYRTVNPDGSASPSYVFKFPVNNGVVSGDMEVLGGKYDEIMITTSRDTSEKVLMGIDFSQVIRDFTIDTGASTLAIKLQQNQMLPAYIAINVPSGRGFIEGASYRYSAGPNGFANGWGSDLVFSKGQLIWKCEVYITKKTLSYIVGGKELQSFFDVTKIIDDDTIEMTAQMPQSLSLNISFTDNAKPVIDSVFPADGATNVPTDIENIVAYFSKNLADLSEMPGAQFGIASEDGSHQITGTYGLSANIFSRQLTNASERVYLKPSTKYNAHVSAVKDEYGNEMIGEKNWSFTTGLN